MKFFVPRPSVDRLDPRTLFAVAPAPSPALQAAPSIQVVIDYSLDANSFFNTQAKRDLLQQAAESVAEWFRDDLLAIAPSGGDQWSATLDHPATGQSHELANLTIAANQVLLFAGGRDMTDALGRGGPGGFRASGSQGWLDRVARRGQTARPGGAEFGPWGGAITFDTNPSSPWHFGATTSGLGGSNDFLSVATHEVAHLFGFGTSDAFQDLVTAGQAFAGPASVALYDGAGNVPLAGDESHWEEGLRDDGSGVAMDPQLTVGTRRLLTPLDYAGLDDLAWSMPPRVALASGPVAAGVANHTFTVTYSHYADVDAATIDVSDISFVAPDGTPLPAASAAVQSGSDARTLRVTYGVAPPGGVWDAADNGVWAVVLAADHVRGTTGEAVAAGTVGTFVADVADAPVGVLQPVAEPTSGAPLHSIVVSYTDAIGVDPATIDVNDVLVTGPGGVVVNVAAAVADAPTVGTPRLVTYSLAAPGGAWGPEDDGFYTVTLRAGEVSDESGNASVEAAVGTFEVSLGAIRFNARTPATYIDASGDLVRISMKGPGAGRVQFPGDRPADAVGVTLDGTTAFSTLVIKSIGAGTPTGAIVVNGPIKSIVGKTADLSGNVTVAGTLGALRLRSAPAGRTVAAPFIGALSAVNWGADVTADVINKVKATTLSGTLRAGTLIGSVAARSMQGARIFAGLRPDYAGGTDLLIGDVVNPAAFVRAVATKAFADSVVVAPTVNKLSMGAVSGTGGAAADRILTASGRTLTAPFRFRNVDAPGDLLRDEAAGVFVLRLI